MKIKAWVGFTAILLIVLGLYAAWFLPEPQSTVTAPDPASNPTSEPTTSTSSPSPTPAPSATPVTATEQDRKQVLVLDAVIAGKNDNDPRLDRELRELTPAARALFRERYRSYPNEQRNEKGTVVFLLGRNLTSSEDFKFLGEVLAEPPCLSLESCGRESTDAKDDHRNLGVDTTLAYPQIVALKSLERHLLTPGTKPQFIEDALTQLRTARGSKIQKVSELAEEILRRYQAGKKFN